jgi:hypothetical protein
MQIEDISRLPIDPPHPEELSDEVRPGRTQPSFYVMIADQPRIVANSLPARTVSQMAPLVITWVSLNKEALLDFWHHGDTWPAAQLISFLQSFQRIKTRALDSPLLDKHFGTMLCMICR